MYHAKRRPRRSPAPLQRINTNLPAALAPLLFKALTLTSCCQQPTAMVLYGRRPLRHSFTGATGRGTPFVATQNARSERSLAWSRALS